MIEADPELDLVDFDSANARLVGRGRALEILLVVDRIAWRLASGDLERRLGMRVAEAAPHAPS